MNPTALTFSITVIDLISLTALDPRLIEATKKYYRVLLQGREDPQPKSTPQQQQQCLNSGPSESSAPAPPPSSETSSLQLTTQIPSSAGAAGKKSQLEPESVEMQMVTPASDTQGRPPPLSTMAIHSPLSQLQPVGQSTPKTSPQAADAVKSSEKISPECVDMVRLRSSVVARKSL